MRKRGEQELGKVRQRLSEAQSKATYRPFDTRAKVPSKGDNTLGPAMYTEVRVNGMPTRALVHTGSPATIISLDHVMKIVTSEVGSQQFDSHWEEKTICKFSMPKVSLSAYGGHRLNILCQICLRLSQGGQTVDGVVLVQPGAPNDLLLGTDFRLVMETPEKLVDLLTGEEHQPKNKDQSTTGPPFCDGETRSIQTLEGAIWENPQPQNLLHILPVEEEVDHGLSHPMRQDASATSSPMVSSMTPHCLMVATAPDVCSEETARVTCSAGGRNPLDSTMSTPTVTSAGEITSLNQEQQYKP
jgi:hypothetical protein